MSFYDIALLLTLLPAVSCILYVLDSVFVETTNAACGTLNGQTRDNIFTDFILQSLAHIKTYITTPIYTVGQTDQAPAEVTVSAPHQMPVRSPMDSEHGSLGKFTPWSPQMVGCETTNTFRYFMHSYRYMLYSDSGPRKEAKTRRTKISRKLPSSITCFPSHSCIDAVIYLSSRVPTAPTLCSI